MPNPKHGFKDFERKHADWAGDRACGTEARAIDVAHSLGITGFNKHSEAKAVNAECEKQNAANAPKPEKTKEKKEKKKEIKDGPIFVGKNADGEGLTAREFDLYEQLTLDTLGYEADQTRQDSINATSIAVQNLANEASIYLDQGATARNTYSEDAASWRTDISTQREKEWRMYDSAMGYKATTDSAKITGEYGKQIQTIANAGSAAVAGIQGEYTNAGKIIDGEYFLQGEKIKGNAARDVAQRNKEATIFGSFLNGFWS